MAEQMMWFKCTGTSCIKAFSSPNQLNRFVVPTMCCKKKKRQAKECPMKMKLIALRQRDWNFLKRRIEEKKEKKTEREKTNRAELVSVRRLNIKTGDRFSFKVVRSSFSLFIWIVNVNKGGFRSICIATYGCIQPRFHTWNSRRFVLLLSSSSTLFVHWEVE